MTLKTIRYVLEYTYEPPHTARWRLVESGDVKNVEGSYRFEKVGGQTRATCSQAIDIDALHAGRLVLDPGQAQATAVAVLEGEPELQAQASASPGAVRVEVSRAIPTMLLRLVGLPTLTVKARATAEPRAP